MKFYKKLLSVVFAAAIVVTTIIPAKSVHATPADGTYTLRKGIDVSKYQNIEFDPNRGKDVEVPINWAAVRQSGIEFVILRIGRRNVDGSLYADEYFEQNYNGARSAGLKVGVYFYSSAINTAEAVEEANYTATLLNHRILDLPVFMDCESSRVTSNGIDSATNTVNISAYCDTIANLGYAPGVYANKTWLNTRMDAGSLSQKYTIWLAHYTSNYYQRDASGNIVRDSSGNPITIRPQLTPSDTAVNSDYAGTYSLFQYTSSGVVPGIVGNVDLDLWYDNSGIFIRKDHAADELPVYRLYNPYSKEHLYTSDENEARTLLNQGWGRFEGEKWTGVTESSSRKDFPVYRLYNPYSGEHLFTQDPNEANTLPSVGWRYEGVCWYSSTDQGTPVYRVYNAGTGEHLFTSDANEVSTLIGRGWSDEGTRWYGVPATN